MKMRWVCDYKGHEIWDTGMTQDVTRQAFGRTYRALPAMTRKISKQATVRMMDMRYMAFRSFCCSSMGSWAGVEMGCSMAVSFRQMECPRPT